MLLIAFEEGIRIIVATPHFEAGKNNIAVESLKEIYEQVVEVAESVSKEFQIILGNELFYTPTLIDDLKAGAALTIDGTRYILVEFQQRATFREMWEGLNNCIFAGYIPILAHTERYHVLMKEPELVNDLIRLGTYIQLNFSSISRHSFDARTSFSHKLLQRRWVHFLGTDTHGADERAPRAKDAVTFLEKRYGEDTIKELLWDNPMTMVEDKHL